ncbi:hypothetical protein D9M71_114130 [compost metagenome]
MHGIYLTPLEVGARVCDVGKLQEGRHHVHHAEDLLVDATLLLHRRNVEDDRHGNPALASEALVVQPWSSTHLGPLRPVVDERSLVPHISQTVVERAFDPLAAARQIERRIAVGAIVRHEQHNGVIELSGRFQILKQAANMMIHVVNHGRVHFHAPGLLQALLFGELIPAWQCAAHRSVRPGSGIDDPQALHSRQALLPNFLVTFGIATFIFPDPCIRSLERPMRRGIGQVREEGLAVLPVGIEVLDQLVGIELRGEEPLGHIDELAVAAIKRLGIDVAIGNLVVIVAGGALQQYVGTLEATSSRALLVGATEVPLARGIGVVAGRLEDLGDIGGSLVEISLVAGLALLLRLHQLGHIAQASLVIVGAREQHRARRRAGGCRMKAGQTHAIPGKRIQVRSFDFTTETAYVAVSHVIGNDDQKIRSFICQCRETGQVERT